MTTKRTPVQAPSEGPEAKQLERLEVFEQPCATGRAGALRVLSGIRAGLGYGGKLGLGYG